MLSIVILAAGQGTRMRSSLPKVLHTLAGKTLLEHVYLTVARLPHRTISIVYGYGGKQVPQRLAHLQAQWVEQADQLGTGHAVAQVMPHILATDHVLILYGDVPLITINTLDRLAAAAMESGFSLLTSRIDDPQGYGRILRNDRGDVVGIVEHGDADEAELAICEINTGMMVVRGDLLQRWVTALGNDNQQGEYYLTDIVGMAVADGISVNTVSPETTAEIRGINDLVQLAETERFYQLVQAHNLLKQGITLKDPARFDLRGELQAGVDVVIDVNVILEGDVSIGNDVSIGANSIIRDSVVGDGVTIEPNCVIDSAVIGKSCRIGPFARIRPSAQLSDNVQIGNFVEIKKSTVSEGTKINHLSYIGDSEIGRDVNIGAGTITCNYDGANKHKTVIEDDVFVGSNTQLVAPITIGAGATIGAGTTVTQDVEAGVLAISRAEQKTVSNWKRPKKRTDD